MRIPEGLAPFIAAGAIGETDAAAAALLVDVARRDAAAEAAARQAAPRRGAKAAKARVTKAGDGAATPADAGRNEAWTEPSTTAWLGMCLALRTPRDGHTCVDLEDARAWAGEIDFDSDRHPPWPATAAEWVRELAAVDRLVGAPAERKPFVLDGTRLYLARSFGEEEGIARVIRGDTRVTVTVLLGGPGTGKTTTVAAELVRRFAEERPPPRLALAAPTAKAAARMTEVLKKRCGDDAALADLGVAVSAAVREAVLAAVDAAPATTVHKLLGANPAARRLFAFDARTPLPYDLVIVDECSMLASSLMHHLLAALAPDTEIRLVGDPDQLVSVEAGSVLADIRQIAARAGWEAAGRSRTLTVQRRFSTASGIGRLADAIRDGRAAEAVDALAAGTPDVRWVQTSHDVEEVVRKVVAEAHGLCAAAAAAADDVLARKGRMQVLCANRDGPRGVSGWNRRIEARLGDAARTPWYAGRPVMVTRNSRGLGLSNGDVGVVVPGRGPRMEAVFGTDARPVRVPVARLENVVTVHALTIHRSQGSEYDHVVVVLPEKKSRLLTRELLYTAVTRAVAQVTVIGAREVIEEAVGRPIRRATGLAHRL